MLDEKSKPLPLAKLRQPAFKVAFVVSVCSSLKVSVWRNSRKTGSRQRSVFSVQQRNGLASGEFDV